MNNKIDEILSAIFRASSKRFTTKSKFDILLPSDSIGGSIGCRVESACRIDDLHGR